jgi:hypothetical protein
LTVRAGAVRGRRRSPEDRSSGTRVGAKNRGRIPACPILIWINFSPETARIESAVRALHL